MAGLNVDARTNRSTIVKLPTTNVFMSVAGSSETRVTASPDAVYEVSPPGAQGRKPAAFVAVPGYVISPSERARGTSERQVWLTKSVSLACDVA